MRSSPLPPVSSSIPITADVAYGLSIADSGLLHAAYEAAKAYERYVDANGRFDSHAEAVDFLCVCPSTPPSMVSRPDLV